MIAPAASPAVLLRVTIPGAPCAQGRPRASVRDGRPLLRDPEKSATWKGMAAYFMVQARNAAGLWGPWARPLSVTVRGYWPRPKALRGSDAQWRPLLPDADNVGKAALDAGNGVLWHDDRQVVRLVVEKWTSAAGGAPHVEIDVSEAA